MAFDDEIAHRYPHIYFGKHWEIDAGTQYLLGLSDAFVQAICQMPMQPGYRHQLLRVSLIKGARATTAIEGNTLSESEVQQVAEGESLPPSKEYQEREVRNILDAMNLILDDVAVDGSGRLITPETILGFHRLVGKDLGEHFDAIPGRFRTDSRVVGPYKCPRPEHVETLVRRLCDWLPGQFGFPTNRQSFADAVVQAIVTHVYLEWIHPFGDGNGRSGRLLEFYILLRAGNPDIASHILSNFYNETRAEYYRQLDQAGRTRDLSAFIRYAVQGYHDGLKEVMKNVAESNIEVAWRYLVHQRFAETPFRKKTVHKRRRALALAISPDKSFKADELMIITPDLAREYAALTERTLLRDINALLEMEIVVRDSDRYRLNFALLVPHMARRRVPHAA